VEAVATSLRNPWAVSPESARILARLVRTEGIGRVLEFGAGMSSRVLGQALDAVGGGRLTAVECHPEWCAVPWAHVRALPSVDTSLIRGTLWLRADWRGVYFGYGEVDQIRNRGPYDLVFIDAPVGVYGREGALHAAITAVAPGGWIVLDDAARPRERRTVRRWLLYYPDLELVVYDETVPRGMAILRRTPAPLRTAQFSERGRDWARSLRETYWRHDELLDHMRKQSSTSIPPSS